MPSHRKLHPGSSTRNTWKAGKVNRSFGRGISDLWPIQLSEPRLVYGT